MVCGVFSIVCVKNRGIVPCISADFICAALCVGTFAAFFSSASRSLWGRAGCAAVSSCRFAFTVCVSERDTVCASPSGGVLFSIEVCGSPCLGIGAASFPDCAGICVFSVGVAEFCSRPGTFVPEGMSLIIAF